MVLLAADDPDESLEEQDDAGRPKAQLDDSETSRAARKVDLDLDDAPFLEDDEDEEEVIEEADETPPSLDEAKPRKERKPPPAWLTNRWVLIGAGSAILLAGLAFFLLSGDKVPVSEEPAPEPAAEEVAAPEPPPEPEIPEEVAKDHLVKLDPFVVEQTDESGEIRFLEVRLVFTTPNEALAGSLVRNTPTVRYALYYYLRNKDLTFLTDETNSEALKQELLSVVNQYMADGRFESLLFEQYVVK